MVKPGQFAGAGSQDPKSKFLFKPKESDSDFFSNMLGSKSDPKKGAGLFASSSSKSGASDGFLLGSSDKDDKKKKKRGRR